MIRLKIRRPRNGKLSRVLKKKEDEPVCITQEKAGGWRRGIVLEPVLARL